MKALAYVIGNSAYSDGQLKNPVNDAIAIGKVLKKLGFIVKVLLDVTHRELDTAVREFGSEVDKYNIGLWYYAGHGMQIDGVNYLTAIDSVFDSAIDAKYSSVQLDKILDYMNHADSDTNIVILDACRNNPFEHRWGRNVASTQLAPVFAPKGTLVAFSTSPKETASDGIGNNSPYALAILQHIEVKNLAVEEFFKRVRNTLYSSTGGKQTSWEHTSLAGTFVFNSGRLVQAIDAPYQEHATADSRYEYSDGDPVDAIISALKTTDWYTQKEAVLLMRYLSVAQANADQLFVIGRSLLSAAEGQEFKAKDFMTMLEWRISDYQQEEVNHVLNGMLFEIYFDGNGLFRAGKFKKTFFKNVMRLRNTASYKNAFEFINRLLEPFQEQLFYIPAPGNQTLSLNIEHQSEPAETIEIIAIKLERKEVLFIEEDPEEIELMPHLTMQFTIKRLRSKIAEEILIPEDLLHLSFNEQYEDEKKVSYPRFGVLKKHH